MFNVYDNLGNNCEAETVEAALTAARQLFEDAAMSGGTITTVIIAQDLTHQDLEAELKRITEEVNKQFL